MEIVDSKNIAAAYRRLIMSISLRYTRQCRDYCDFESAISMLGLAATLRLRFQAGAIQLLQSVGFELDRY